MFFGNFVWSITGICDSFILFKMELVKFIRSFRVKLISSVPNELQFHNSLNYSFTTPLTSFKTIPSKIIIRVLHAQCKTLNFNKIHNKNLIKYSFGIVKGNS